MKRKFIILLLIFILPVVAFAEEKYVNYYGVEFSEEDYSTMVELGFSEDEIYYMSVEEYNNNQTKENLLFLVGILLEIWLAFIVL